MRKQILNLIVLLCLGISTQSIGQATAGFSDLTEAIPKRKIFLNGNNFFIVDYQKGVLCYDVSDPKNVKFKSSLRLEGVVDIAVRGSYLFANQYDELIVLQIDFNKGDLIRELKRIKDVFPNYRETPGTQVASLKMYNSLNTYKENVTLGGTNPSIGGSMSCISLKGSVLYAITDQKLMTFNARISEPDYLLQKTSTKNLPVERGILETIWVDKKRLFIGSKVGVFIFDLQNRLDPNFVHTYTHDRACDPVVVWENYAYITMRDGYAYDDVWDCEDSPNQLFVANITNPEYPVRTSIIEMENPHGLSVSDQLLIVCDGRAGLKVFSLNKPDRPKEIAKYQEPNFSTYDVIFDSRTKVAFVSTKQGWSIFNLNQPNKPIKLGSHEL